MEKAMAESVLDKIRIRPMTEGDLDAIIEIDKKVLGEERADYWKRKISLRNERSTITHLVAEAEGKLVGFILGDISGWEFHIPNTIGWVDTLGVDPAYQREGLAGALLNQMIKNFRQRGVETIYTLVNWSSWDLLQFFKKAGFTRGDMINLELKI